MTLQVDAPMIAYTLPYEQLRPLTVTPWVDAPMTAYTLPYEQLRPLTVTLQVDALVKSLRFTLWTAVVLSYDSYAPILLRVMALSYEQLWFCLMTAMTLSDDS